MKFNLRKVFIISILVLCIIAINLAVFFKITETSYNKNGAEELIIDTAMLTETFNKIFDNQINYQNSIINVSKTNNAKELVHTSYNNQEEINNQYMLNVNIPNLNINNENAEKINEEINSLFYKKAINVLAKTEKYTIYNVKYKAYVNDNILSLVIMATLKEGEKPQREIIKTYNYNLTSNRDLNLREVLQYRQLPKEKVQNKIYEIIKTASENAKIYNELGYNKFLRNINDSIYKIENTTVFFIGEGKALYILYPYGNSNYTSETDLLVI